MHAELDETHAPGRTSWIESANGHADFPIQNLPFGVFSPKDGEPRGGVAIGDSILDLAAAIALGLFDGAALSGARAAAQPRLNDFMALGRGPRTALRRRLGELLDGHGPLRAGLEAQSAQFLRPATDCRLHVPADIGDYTDFYAGIHHARNVGRQFRPDQPLLPNYKHVPIGYHGRASSIRASGTPLARPSGQLKPSSDAAPIFGPSRRLDYELELGVWVGPGNVLGEPIAIDSADEHMVGLCLLNDWSARDIQAWEYQPLGPFLAKNFLTTISPWIITCEALAPFTRAPAPRPSGDPRPLPYLWSDADQAYGALDVTLEVYLSTPGLAAAGLPAQRVSSANAAELYWTFSQLLAHHTCGGCNLRAGDLLGTGTISGEQPGSFGSLLESTVGGQQPLRLANGETRCFLEDGDTVSFRAVCRRPGAATIGFGDCRGTVAAG